MYSPTLYSRDSNDTKNIVIAGEIHSDNLGDRVIADCMRLLIQNAFPDANVRTIDVSGRTPREPAVARKRFARGIKRLFPPRIANLIIWEITGKRTCQQYWRPFIDMADVLIVGGGQLLMDNALSFPLRLSALAYMASARMPMHLAACGVSENRPWSRYGRLLVKQVLLKSRSISVRDNSSRLALKNLFPQNPATQVLDPALYANQIYDVYAKSSEVIGLCVLSPIFWTRNNPELPPLTISYWCDFWHGLIRLLQESAFEVQLFCTGVEGDHAFAREVGRASGASIAERPFSAGGLVNLIYGYQAIVATRLHASIVATSLRIPSVGLSWDKKVSSFYCETSRADLCLAAHVARPDAVSAALAEAIERGIGHAELERWQCKARQVVDTIREI